MTYDGRPECIKNEGLCVIDEQPAKYYECRWCIPGIPHPDQLANGLNFKELLKELNKKLPRGKSNKGE